MSLSPRFIPWVAPNLIHDCVLQFSFTSHLLYKSLARHRESERRSPVVHCFLICLCAAQPRRIKNGPAFQRSFMLQISFTESRAGTGASDVVLASKCPLRDTLDDECLCKQTQRPSSFRCSTWIVSFNNRPCRAIKRTSVAASKYLCRY